MGSRATARLWTVWGSFAAWRSPCLVRSCHEGVDIVAAACLTCSCSVLWCSSAEEVEEEGHAKPPLHLVHASRPIP